MSCWITTNYQIYPGWNEAASLALVTSYTDSDSVAFLEPYGIDNSIRGELMTRSNGTPAYRGKPSVIWYFGWLTYGQWEYAKDNWQGLVTVKCAVNDSTFANYNAILRVEDSRSMTKNLIQTKYYSGRAFINAPFTLTIEEAL